MPSTALVFPGAEQNSCTYLGSSWSLFPQVFALTIYLLKPFLSGFHSNLFKSSPSEVLPPFRTVSFCMKQAKLQSDCFS